MALLPGRHVISERGDAPFCGYWAHEKREAANPLFADLRKAYDLAINSADAFAVFKKAHVDGGMYSEKGLREELHKYAAEQLPELMKNRLEATARTRREALARREAMAPVKIDRTDLFAELQRREIRDRFNAMPAKKREEAVRGDAPAELIDALLAAPAMSVNLPPSMLEMIRSKRLQTTYGAEADTINEVLEATDAVDRAYEAARDEIRHHLGLSKHEFDGIATQLEEPVVRRIRDELDRTPPAAEPFKPLEA